MEKICYSVKEAAKVIGVSYSILYREIHEGRFPYIRVGCRILIPDEMLREFIHEKVMEAVGNE